MSSLDAKLTDTRRAMRAGVLLRSLFTFYPQLPPFAVPKTGGLPQGALGTMAHRRGGGPDSEMPAAGGGGRADERTRWGAPRKVGNFVLFLLAPVREMIRKMRYVQAGDT